MRTLWGLICATTMMASSLAALADVAAPRPFVAVYEVTYRGLHAGSLTFELTREGPERYVFQTHADPSGLARLVVSSAARERTALEIGPDGVRPLEWRLEDGKSGDKRDGSLQFDWERNVARGVIERERIDLPLEPGLQDRLSIQIAASTRLMRGEEPGTIPLIDDNRVKQYTYTRKEAVQIDTPEGALDAVIYESTRPGSSRVSKLWLAPALDYAPVRAEQIRKGKVETVMVLKSWDAS